MTAVARVFVAVAIVSTVAIACASKERPEVVPGSTIATSTSTSAPGSTTAVPNRDFDDDSAEKSTMTGTSTTFPFLDPNDPNYPTTIPQPPRPSVSYPTSG